ncbi:MAG: hypothetical protein SPI91_00925 [Bacilli bacterium]|jgi:hypothetical protein|nr:hypothetical protein [Bacilli bacterium]
MKDVRVIEFDKYEYGIVINALNEFRNKLIAEDRDTTVVDELLLKVLDTPLKKRMFPKHYVEER